MGILMDLGLRVGGGKRYQHFVCLACSTGNGKSPRAMLPGGGQTSHHRVGGPWCNTRGGFLVMSGLRGGDAYTK